MTRTTVQEVDVPTRIVRLPEVLARRADEAGTPVDRLRADPPRQNLANGAPIRGALPMMCLRVMPLLRCENDVGGRFTVCPIPDSHGTRHVSAEAAASYASAARPGVAGRAATADAGATPPADALVMAWGHACFHTPCPRRGRSRPSIPPGRLSARC